MMRKPIEFRINAYGSDDERIYLVDPRSKALMAIDDLIAKEIFECIVESQPFGWPFGDGPDVVLGLPRDSMAREVMAGFIPD